MPGSPRPSLKGVPLLHLSIQQSGLVQGSENLLAKRCQAHGLSALGTF